jgi:DNA-binding transcriptional LysR family regulator
MSVPTVWQHIQALEKVYGLRLFKKEGRNVVPTEAAEKLYVAVDEILVRLDSTFDLADGGAEAPITLVTGVRMMMEDLAEPLAAFCRRHANPILLRQGNDRRAEELILADDADLALTLESGPGEESPLIHYEPAYAVDFLAAAPRKHPYASAGTSSLRELVKHPLIVTAPGTHGRDALEQALHRERLTAKVAVETDNSGFTIACVQAGMGLGILAGREDGPLCSKLVTRSLRRQLGQRRIVFMWRKGRMLSEPILDLIEEVRRRHA